MHQSLLRAIMTATPLIEICVEGVDGAIAAEAGGADRVELCASLIEGGITPSLGTLRETLRAISLPVHVMLRPRGGDFLYSDREFASMLDDAATFRDAGAAGLVFGCLSPDGTIDVERTTRLVAAAHPASTTFHRAFDMTADAEAALETLITCGIHRVLTSGQAPTARAGLQTLAGLVTQAGDRIIILGCGAVRPDNIAEVRSKTGLTELHFSAPINRPSPMEFRNPALTMGATPNSREYTRTETNPALIRTTIAAARAT